jgi:hypothetical protein
MSSNTNIISTSQAPDAKPIGVSRAVTTTWETIVEAPRYEVPQQTFGGGTNIVPGVAEIISPLLVSNIGITSAAISVRIFREDANSHFVIINELPVPANDMIPIPLNGQFIYTGDTLDVQASSNDSLNVTISYTVGQAEEDDVV